MALSSVVFTPDFLEIMKLLARIACESLHESVACFAEPVLPTY